MLLGLGLGVGVAKNVQVVRPTLAQLVNSFNPLVVCEADVPSSRWQNSTRTTIVTAADQEIGAWDSQCVGLNHLVQATAGRRPLYKTDGTYHWLESDGTDDCIAKAFSTPQPWWRIAGVRILTWSTSKRLFAATLGATSAGLLVASSSIEPKFNINSGASLGTQDLTVGTDFITVEAHNSGSSSFQVNNETPVTGNAGTSETDGLSIFASNGAAPIAARCYFVAMGAGAIPTNLAAIKAYGATKCAAVL